MSNDVQQHTTAMEFLVFKGTEATWVNNSVVAEHSYQLQLNQVPLVDIQCMPDKLGDLAVGFLVSEGLIQERYEFKELIINSQTRTVNIQAEIPADRTANVGDKMKVTSGCGRGISIDNIDEVMNCNRPFNLTRTMNAREVMKIGYEFNRIPGLYRETRCVHSAALCRDNELVHFAEDIGRHNAVDKVIGKAFLNAEELSDYVLLCTGRFSFDMVAKAARIRIPIIITPAAATQEAIALAQKFHITLCGRVRKQSMIVYSTNWRIIR